DVGDLQRDVGHSLLLLGLGRLMSVQKGRTCSIRLITKPNIWPRFSISSFSPNSANVVSVSHRFNSKCSSSAASGLEMQKPVLKQNCAIAPQKE
ncbi:hypothetical protein FRX31_018008, partial [Thalictrum thalictroides]